MTAPTSTSDQVCPTGPSARRTGVCGLSIAVVGGSLTGPLTALLLLQAGFENVSIYEAAPRAASRGGGLIGLEHPALNVLDGLGIDQDEVVVSHSEVVEQIAVQQRRAGARIRSTYPGRSTTWTRLHNALTVRLPTSVIQYGCRIQGLGRAGSQPVLEFDGGRSECADLIVFADGRTSIGRRLLDPTRPLTYAGYVAHRGMAPTDLGTSDFLRFEARPGAQFTIAAVPGGSDWTFYLNTTAPEFTRLFGAPPQQRAFVLPRHVSVDARRLVNAQAHQLLPAEQASTVENTLVRMAVPMMDVAPPTRMTWALGEGHGVLIGDALAPVRPHTAKGANQGFEHVRDLVATLTQHRKFRADLTTALNGWQQRHLPAAQAAVAAGPVLGRRLGLGYL